MQGRYTLKSGEKVDVLTFDAENNIAYVDFGGEKRWVGRQEYIEWVGETVVEETTTDSEPTVFVEKKPKAKKKKDETD